MRSRTYRMFVVATAVALFVLVLAPRAVATGISPIAPLLPQPVDIGQSLGRSGITIANSEADPGWVLWVEWADKTFAAHGLELPAVSVVLGSDPELCEHNKGRFLSDPHPLVYLCELDDCTVGQECGSPTLVLHELAHAWVDANVGDSQRAAFMRLRGLESWNDSEQPWGLRGCEQAANVIARALVYGHEARAGQPCAFTVLTGIDPPYGLDQSCIRPDRI